MQTLSEQARFHEAGALYDAVVSRKERSSPDAALLRGRLYLKTDQPEEAQGILLSLQPQSLRGKNCALRDMHLAMAYARLNEFELADKYFDAAQSVIDPGDTGLLAEVSDLRARRYLLELRIADAWDCNKATLGDRSTSGKVRSAELRAFILAHEERYAEQAESLMHLLRLLEHHREDHLETWYVTVHALAVLAREMPIAEATPPVERELKRDTQWPPDFTFHFCQALKAIAWCKALSGDYLGCYRYLREAQRVGPEPTWQAMVHLDRAYFARVSGDERWSADEIAAADELAQRIDWRGWHLEERVALLLLAILLAPTDSDKAAYYIGRYKALPKGHSSVLAFAFDRRPQALADAAIAAVREARGDNQAVTALQSAWNTFDRIGYDWRAGRAATRLFKATGNARWRRLAQEKLEPYRSSWLVADLQAVKPTASVLPATLTSTQNVIFRMICSGMDTKEISVRLKRSQWTIRNHVKLVFKAFGVRSRAALVALAAKNKLI